MQRVMWLVLLTALLWLWGLNQNVMAQAPSPGFNPVLSPEQIPPPVTPKMNKLGSKPLTKLPNKLAVTPVEKKPGTIIIPRENCGDYHTGWVDVPNADVNPCPKSCQRGEQLSVKQHPANTSLYDALYHCYLPEMLVNQSPEVIKQLKEKAPPRQNCGTFWADRVDDPNEAGNPCPTNCERGELRSVSRILKGDILQYDMNYQCYVAEPAPTLSTGKPPVSKSAMQPKVIKTETIRISGIPPKVIVTPRIEMTGMQPKVITTSKIEINGVQPKVIVTPRIEMTGLQPKVITTPKIEINGVQPKVIVTPRIEISGIRQNN